MRVLVLSAYDADSHCRWRQNLSAMFPEWCWTCLVLPPRFFSWRVRGNSLTWALTERETLERPYDVLIATSMVDLSALRGMVPALATIPTLLYFHENQFVYPTRAEQHPSVEPQIVSLYSALCADRLVFNSCFNRDSFFRGVTQLLNKLPDGIPPGVVSILESKAEVLAVPLEDDCWQLCPRPATSERLQIVWNHRWEYDKNPDLLLATIGQLQIHYGGDLPFTLHVTGQSFRQVPEAFAALHTLLSSSGALGQWGYLEDAGAYRRLLAESHLVLSTADHDFQGLAVLEAVAAACVPLVPAHQVYPEWFDARWCYPVTGNTETDGAVLARAIIRYCEMRGQLPPAPEVNQFSVTALKPAYHKLLTS